MGTVTLVGDVNGSGDGVITTTLNLTGVVAGIYGSNNSVPKFKVDEYGRIISVSVVPITAPSGTAGPQGPRGLQGLIGDTGPAGATGPAGVAGPAGLTGPAGSIGPQGVQGIQGPVGGSNIVTAATAAATAATASAQSAGVSATSATSNASIAETASAQAVQAAAQAAIYAAQSADRYFLHDQAIPSMDWVVQHNLNKYPAVSIVDSSGDQVEGEVHYDGINTLRVTFSAPFAGKAYIN